MLTLLATPSSAHAIFVLRKGETQPLLGHLVSENERQVVVRLEKAGAERDVTIPKGEIEELIRTVDPERLAALSPEQPAAYREYAEELSERKIDPEARDTARRLLVIAAQLDGPGQGRSALLALAALARTPQEEAACRAAAFAYDPEHDRGLLKPWRTARLEPAATHESHDELLRALVAARHGEWNIARRLMESPKGKAQSALIESILPRKEFLAACTANKLTDDQLRRLLSAELALLRRDTEVAARPETVPSDWSHAARAKDGLAPLPAIGLEQLTEFDPRASLFRNGKWRQP